MERSEMTYDVIVGLDVGKASDHAHALLVGTGECLFEGEVPQAEHDLKGMLSRASALGRTLLVVDVWGGFGTLPALVARDMGIDVAHMPSRAFAKAAESYGEDKTDRIDAYVLADATRWRPGLVHLVGRTAEAIEETKILAAERRDLVDERTRLFNRAHDLLQRLCPPLEALFAGRRLHADGALSLFARYGGPSGFRRAGRKRCAAWASRLGHQTTRGPRKVEEIFVAISSQGAVPAGAGILEDQLRRLCTRILELNVGIARVEDGIKARMDDIPAARLLLSIPGMGPWTAAVIASEIGDISRFRSEAALATYCGVTPKARVSGTSLNGAKARKTGNKVLKNAIMQSAQAAIMHGGPERDYYDKKRAEGKKHRQALRSLARRRVALIYAMLSSGTLYEPSRMVA